MEVLATSAHLVFTLISILPGEGGMVLTDQPKIAERCKSMRNLALEIVTDLNMNRWVGIFA